MFTRPLGAFLACTIPALASPDCGQCQDDDHSHAHSCATDSHDCTSSGCSDSSHVDLDAEDDAWFHFHPFLSAAIAIGGSTSTKNLTLIPGGHAPIDDGFNLQGLELGFLSEFGDALSFQTNYLVYWDSFDGWDGEWEEAFVAAELPGDIRLRGGQFLVPFGRENQLHLHARDFVEPSMSVIRLLGEDGLYVQGADLAFNIPSPAKKTIFRFGYGQGREHTHGFSKRDVRNDLYREAQEHLGGHDDDHDDDHHDDDDDDDHGDDHGDEHDHAHGFAGNGGIYDVDDAYLDDGFFFGRLESDIPNAGALKRAGISAAGGENGYGRTTWIVGADVGGSFEIGGCPAWWDAEAFYRYVDAYDSAGRPGHFDESGIYGSVGCEFVEDWTVAARAEWASGNRMAGLERRWRLSANLTHVSEFSNFADLHSRIQYTFEDLGGYATDHAVWFQFVLNLGKVHPCHIH